MLPAALMLWAVVVAVIDWRSRRVPNLLLLVALLPAMTLLFWRGTGPLDAAVWPSVVGFAAGFLLTLPGYTASRLGAGDVKLAAVVGLLLGWPLVLWGLLVAALWLGAQSLATVMLLGLANARSLRLPAAVALAGGFIVVLLAHREAWL